MPTFESPVHEKLGAATESLAWPRNWVLDIMSVPTATFPVAKLTDKLADDAILPT
jgi:hypothetical protein